MKKWTAISMAMLLVLAIFGSQALAGEDHKCDHETEQCLNHMAEKLQGRGWSGVEMDYHDGAAAVKAVHAGTPADKAGVKVGDVLLAINGVEVNEENHEKLAAFEDQMKPGKSFDYTIGRNGKEKQIKLTLVDMPQSAVAAIVGDHMLTGHTSVELASN